jgi:hypothetical protein
MNGSNRIQLFHRTSICAAVTTTFCLIAGSLAILASPALNHTPPFEFGKLGGQAFCARGQP